MSRRSVGSKSILMTHGQCVFGCWADKTGPGEVRTYCNTDLSARSLFFLINLSGRPWSFLSDFPPGKSAPPLSLILYGHGVWAPFQSGSGRLAQKLASGGPQLITHGEPDEI